MQSQSPSPNQRPNLLDVRTLPHVRVTGMATFQKCPASWAVRTFATAPQRDSPYARIGTAVHLVVERFLKRRFELEQWYEQYNYLRSEGVSTVEVNNVYEYLLTLKGWRDSVIACEHEFNLRMENFGLPIQGHMDAVFLVEDGLMILDHKTNRHFQPKDWWAQQFQPLLYSWAARKLWPNYAKQVHYQIGYVNLGTTVTWTTGLQDDAQLEATMASIWREMEECSNTQFFPQRVNEDCGYCPIREQCSTYRNELSTLLESFTASVAERPLPEQLLWITAVRKAAERAEEDIKQRMADQIKNAGGVLAHGQHEFKLKYGTRRVADYTEVRLALADVMAHDPESVDIIADLAPAIFSVKVGGLEALAKSVPKLRPVVGALLREVQNNEPAIVASRVRE